MLLSGGADVNYVNWWGSNILGWYLQNNGGATFRNMDPDIVLCMLKQGFKLE